MGKVTSILEIVSDDKERMIYLGQEYPSLYIYILEHLERSSEVDQYMAKCKELEEDESDKYSLYIHGYWLVWLEKQRQAGCLKQGTYSKFTKLVIDSQE